MTKSKDQSRVESKSRPARVCYAAKRILRNLETVVFVLRSVGLLQEASLFKPTGTTCQSMTEDWKRFCRVEIEKIRFDCHRRRKLSLALEKGTKKLFDERCRPCDSVNAMRCKKEWLGKMSVPHEPLCPEFRDLIKRKARFLMGSTWWDKRRQSSIYIPDQKGCRELERMLGGTLSCPEPNGDLIGLPYGRENGCVGGPSPVYFVREGHVGGHEREVYSIPREGHNLVRLGCAKTKGKMRVVTMQGSETKRLLRPVHEAAYDYISSFGWCVRGELSEQDLVPILDDWRKGEFYISGDYESATDNLNADAVIAVVEVLAEALPGDLARVLLESFRDVTVMGGKPIRRGSMMGNLCSFVVLCLLNKVCHEITVDRLGYPERKVRINGDDIVFCGDEETYSEWKKVTASVGFVVNESKTGTSREFIELNSKVFSRRTQKFIKKLNFGFLRFDTTPDEAGTCLFSLCDLIGYSSAMQLLSRPRVRAVLENKELTLNCVPTRWYDALVKRWWFRRLILSKPDVEATGNERVIPTVEGFPLKAYQSRMDDVIISLECAAEAKAIELVDSWKGRMNVCPDKKISMIFNQPRSKLRELKGKVMYRSKRWVQRYDKAAYDWIWDNGLQDILLDMTGKTPRNSVNRNPYATLKWEPEFERTSPTGIPPPLCLVESETAPLSYWSKSLGPLHTMGTGLNTHYETSYTRRVAPRNGYSNDTVMKRMKKSLPGMTRRLFTPSVFNFRHLLFISELWG